MINREEVLRLAELAKLRIAENELDSLSKSLSEMLESIDKIKEVATEGVSPSYNSNNSINPLRDDVIEKSMSREDILKNTKEVQYGYFKILKVMD